MALLTSLHELFETFLNPIDGVGRMAEVGLVRFAQVALDVAQAVLPAYRSKFSKHLFTQPQLLAVLCLMRFEDWTFREAEVRIGEHRELREALGLARVPDFTTLNRFLHRLPEQVLTRALGETVGRMAPPPSGCATVAVDATGLTPGAVSTFFVKRLKDRGGVWHRWINGWWR